MIFKELMKAFYAETFAAKARKWCRTLPVASIHNWNQFVIIFVCKFDHYDYDQVCDEIEYLRNGFNIFGARRRA